jgi:LysR family hydrogen peroxide-inducible transcriptional activator
MNIQQLEYIIAVDRFKSFTKASEYCNITQATLSAMVKKLEEELDVVIFDRKASPIITTDIGQAILEDSRVVVARVNQIREKASGISHRIRGRIRLGVIPTIANSLLPRIVPSFMQQFPDLHLEIHEITTQSIIKQLKDGSIDLGILATPNMDDDVVEEILYYESLMVYGDIDRKTKYLLPEHIRNQKVWLLEKGHCLRDQFVNLCGLRKKDSSPGNLSFDASSFDTLLNMVDRFGGLTLIPELYYKDLPGDKQKKAHAFKSPVPVREVSLVYYRPYAKQRVIRVLADFIQQTIRPELSTKTLKKTEQIVART